MKRELFVTMISASLLGMVCHAENAAPAKPPAVATNLEAAVTGTPKIDIDRMVYDFGSTSLVSQLSGTFVISNAGTALLELKKPAPSCGCTVASLKTDKLAPGEKTDLGFTVNVGNMTRGHIEKHIGMPSNDPKTPSVQLTVKADIISVYEYTPQSVAVGDVHLGTTTNVSIQVKRTDGKPLNIGKVEATGQGAQSIHTKLETTEAVVDSGTIQLEIVADGSPRRFNLSIGVYAPDGKAPLFSVPLNGRFVGDVTLDMEALYWSIVDPANWPGNQGQAVTTKRVKISSTLPGQKLVLNNATSSLSDVKVSVNPIDDGKAYEVVAVVDKPPKELVHGTIKVETNVKSQPSIEIPFTINVLRAN